MKEFDLNSKKRGGAFLLIGFTALGEFVVQRGFTAERRVQTSSVLTTRDVIESHESGLFSGLWNECAEAICFQRGSNALDRRVGVAVAFAAHRGACLGCSL